MGMQVEFNWYLVYDTPGQEVEDGIYDSETGDFIQTDTFRRLVKEEARIYPVGGVVPIVSKNQDRCVGLAHIRQTSHYELNNKIHTTIDYEEIMTFDENNPVGKHYTDMWKAYKTKQQVENHGGKFKVQDFVNALERRSFEKAIKDFHGGSNE